MSSEKVIDNVQPYKQNDLWDDITRSFLLPSRQVSSIILSHRKILRPTLPTRITVSFLTVINEAYTGEIASCIDKKEFKYSLTNNPYEFEYFFMEAEMDLLMGHFESYVIRRKIWLSS
ncbi:hypothetical protein C2G38_2197902 [Gigaspora rosea]|uniref:Uncharacterized protein n=1 Tax=Gigaspora rosea TaxID=44941 RepID=A0A397UW72_9GLOM|nr:hypothetical protein C2G38_2197902 [Gigaspora rosea]